MKLPPSKDCFHKRFKSPLVFIVHLLTLFKNQQCFPTLIVYLNKKSSSKSSHFINKQIYQFLFKISIKKNFMLGQVHLHLICLFKNLAIKNLKETKEFVIRVVG